MRRIIARILAISMLLTGCTVTSEQNQQEYPTSSENIYIPEVVEEEITTPTFKTMESEGLLEYVEDTIYTNLVDNLDSEEFFIEEVSTRYVSKDYLDESKYNSLENIFFGYNINDLNKEFLGSKFVFTLDENGNTTVLPMETIDSNTYEQVIKNVAVGSGVILVSVSVALVTKNLPASISAGKTVRLVFTVSSAGAKAGTVLALQSAGVAASISGFIEAMRTGDIEQIKESMLLAASEGFKFGAIGGVVTGIAEGIKILDNWRYFKEGTAQAMKYPEGVEFTKTVNDQMYPRFEKWAVKTVKFDKPTLENVVRRKCLNGDYGRDAALANAKIGLKNTPAGYVWHHVEDMQTMILIPKDLHNIALGGMPHKGGASLVEKYLRTLA